MYVAHVVIKREKTQFLLDFSEMHLKKKMSCDALGYSSKWEEKEEGWSFLLFPRFQDFMAETVNVNIFHMKFSLTMQAAFVPP